MPQPPKRIFAPVMSNRVSIASPQLLIVGIVVCEQSKSEQEPNFSHSQVGQSHSARVTPSVEALKGVTATPCLNGGVAVSCR